MELRAAEMAAATGGELLGDDVIVNGASIDSRAVRPGQLFVPIVAERDGHDFIAGALEAGAVAYLTSRAPVGGTAIAVEDTGIALEDLGRLARSRIEGDGVIAITGSVGKTTVKDLLRAVLAQRLATYASPGNFNNELGVPLTLLEVPAGTKAVVVEMGARGVGHIARLCAIAQPQVGVVTRVTAAHTEVFGSLEDIALAKGELIEALPEDGTAVLNNEDERVAAMADRFTGLNVIRYGDGGDVVAEDVTFDDELRPSFTLRTPWGDARVRLPIRGQHQVSNALAAASAGLSQFIAVDAVAAGLEATELTPGRMQLVRPQSGARVIDDSYNANPASVSAALEALAAMAAARHTAVLGVMAELGPGADDEHAGIGDLARRLGVRLIAVAAPAYGGEDVADIDEAVAALGELDEGDAVLVKGSRVAGLERLVSALVG